MSRFEGKVSVVTGASRGIGRAIAEALASRGARVVMAARGRESLESAASEIGERATALAGDVGDPAFCRYLAREVTERHGPIDILVNNAGVGVFRPVVETREEEIEAPLRVPVLAAMTLTHACLPAMLERRSGVIVNLTSVGGKIVIPNSAAYTAGRFGITGFTHSLQEELRGRGVRAILMCPGEVDTEYFERNRSTADDLPKSRKLFRVLTAREVAEATMSAIASGPDTVIIPGTLRMFVALYQACPPLGRWLLRSLG